MDTIAFTFDGQPVTARAGDSIAVALEAAGVRRLGATGGGRDRGVYCGMGVCQECMVVADGRRSTPACMTTVRSGMHVTSQDDATTAVAPNDETAPASLRHRTDLAIVGAGPAGLEAACAAAEAGCAVIVIDERGAPGGQYFKPPAAAKAHRDKQHRRGDALRRRFAQSGATLISGAAVWYARRAGDRFDLRYMLDDQQGIVESKAVIIATGAYERPAVVPGWCQPGVMTIGAAQTYARRYGRPPLGRVLIAGHGPLGIQLGAELLRLGAPVVGVADRSAIAPMAMVAAAKADARLVASGAGYMARLALARVPVWRKTEVTSITNGPAGGFEVALTRVGGGGKARIVHADTVCMGDGFVPQIELPRLLECPLEFDDQGLPRPVRDQIGATPVSGLWIAGDAGGIGGADQASAQGRLAGQAAARFLGRTVTEDLAAHNRAERARRFQAALWQSFAARPRPAPQGATVVCRCEGVTADAITSAIADGARSPGHVKRLTRCGMGRCQGRNCMTSLISMLHRAGETVPVSALMAPQLPAKPVRASLLGREKPEWGGHRLASPASRPVAGLLVEPLRVTRADMAVIGAGVMGLCAAREAARQGASVVCLDRGEAGAEASGGNAGSLHLQLLSWDFGAKAVAGGSPALQTLPLQRDSIALWRDIEREVGVDFEIKTTGGLMLAEDRAQIAFLERKCEAERSVGIESRVIGADEIRSIAPHVSDRFAAAAWCPGEGKINPLPANEALRRDAERRGAIIEQLAPVTDIARTKTGYRIRTARGTLDVTRLVIAAGGWSAEIAAMLDVEVPVRGAPLQMVVTEPVRPLVSQLIAHADRHLTLKQTSTGQVLIGGAWPARVTNGGRVEVLADSLEGNLWVAARTVPAVGALSVVRSWAAMNIDIDGAPLISLMPGLPGAVIAATANGYTLGPLVGEAAAQAALSGAMPSGLSPFGLDRFDAVGDVMEYG